MNQCEIYMRKQYCFEISREADREKRKEEDVVDVGCDDKSAAQKIYVRMGNQESIKNVQNCNKEIYTSPIST